MLNKTGNDQKGNDKEKNRSAGKLDEEYIGK